jgi:hypothetical protein
MAKGDNIPDVSSIAAQLESEYSDRNSMIEEMRALRDMEITPEVPAGMEPELVVTPIASQIVERMVGLLTTDPMRIEVPPSGVSETQGRQASKMERWTKAALDELERQADEDIRERIVENMIVDGAAAARMMYAPGLWAGMPTKEEYEGTDAEYNKEVEQWKVGRPLPIVWSWLDPLCVYPIWSEAGLECVLEKDQRNLATLDPKKFNMSRKANPEIWQLDRHSDTGGKVEFIQYWTRDTLTYCVDGEVVHHTKHQYRRPPYIYSYGAAVSSKDSQKRGRSMLYNLRYLLPYFDRLLSQKATAIRIWCWPTPVFKQSALNMPAVDAATGKPTPLRSIEVQPGKAVSLYSDEEITFLTWNGSGPDADEMISLINGMIQQAGLSDVMYGQGGDQSGYGINQLIAAARVRFKPIIKHAERAIESQIQTLWDIIEYQIKTPVPIYVGARKKGEWLSLGPDDLKGYRQVKVSLNPIIPTDTYARSSQAINEVQAGLRTRRSAMEAIGIEQPDEMEDELLVEAFKMRPEVQEMITQEALKRVQFNLEMQQEQQQSLAVNEFMEMWPQLPQAAQQAIMAQMMAGGQQGMPPGGMPPDMGGMPPDMAMMGGGGMPPVAPGPMQTVGNSGAQVMMGPGSNYGTPAPPTTQEQAQMARNAQANAPQTRGAPVRKLGPKPRPSGVATGKPTGPRKRGIE